MYDRVAKAIRQVDRHHILFLEPCMYATGGFGSDLQPIIGPDGARDPLQALAPHAYDIGTEKPGAGSANEQRMRLIIGRLTELARRLNMPMLVGEWGAFQGESYTRPLARLTVRIFEQSLVGDTYWFFTRWIERTPQFESLQRPYPRAIAGTLLRYRFDPETVRFECTWKEDSSVHKPTEVYIPDRWYPNGFELQLAPTGGGHHFQPVGPGRRNGYLRIPPGETAAERHLTISAKP
jgi:endoglycosylceramidase